MLRLVEVSRRFPGVLALDGVSLEIAPGELHALMGENGAGKSTLMKIACGLHAPSSGHVELDGRPIAFAGTADAAAAGIRTVFQELTVLDNLDVGRNVMIGQEPVRAGGAWLDRAALYRGAQAVLDRLGIALDPRTPVRRLSAGQRQMVEIARACAIEPRVLILDEPTSSLGRHEEELLFALIERLREAGVALVYITHRMSEVFRLADRITVLRDGRHVVTDVAAALDREALIRAMVGRSVEESPRRAPAAALPVRLSVHALSRSGAVREVSLALRAGEVLGVAGLMGAGRTELARLIAGVDRADGGTMQLDGVPYAPRDVADAIRAGVCYVSEDRKALGLIQPLSVGDNLALPGLRRFLRHGFLSRAAIRRSVAEWSARLGVRAASPEVAVETLSGGNQQKVALAKWLALAPGVILLDEPTRGVDIGAKEEIHRLVRGLAADGAAVLAISSELPEVLRLSDRIAVMAGGRLIDVVPAADATEQSLLELAFREPDEAGTAPLGHAA